MAEYIEREQLPLRAEFTPLDGYANGWNDCLNVISEIPAADVQPVKHGKWETEICDDGFGAYNLFVCSLCGSESAKRFNYCRECGAKMDGET